MSVLAVEVRARLLPILLSQLTGLACGLVGIRLVSNWVDPEDYGVYGIFLSLALVGSSVVYAGLAKSLSRHWQACPDRPSFLREILIAAARKTIWLALAAALAALLVARHDRVAYGVLLFTSAFGLGLLQLAQSALQAARHNWSDFRVAAGASLTRSFLPPLFYHTAGGGVRLLLAGFAGHALMGAVLGLSSLRRWWPARSTALSPPTYLASAYDGPQFVILAIAAWTLLGLNRWLVAGFFGAETAGYFVLAGNMGGILPTILGAVVLQYFQPRWFAYDVDTPEARRILLSHIDRVAGAYTAVAVLALATLHACMPLLIGTLVDARYASSVEFVFVSGCSTTAAVLNSPFHAALIAAHRERACVRVDLGGAACVLLGSIAAAAIGLACFKAWLVASLLVPWMVNRTLARRALLAPADT